jgi:hypothetical protein
LQKFTNVSEVLAATIIRAICPGDGGSKHFWYIGKLLPDYMAQQPRRQPSSYSATRTCNRVMLIVMIIESWTGERGDRNWFRKQRRLFEERTHTLNSCLARAPDISCVVPFIIV